MLLGRPVSRAEVDAQSGWVGGRIDGLVRSFLQSEEFARRGLVVLAADPDRDRFDPRADAADILACFRLLLGRVPGEHERDGHFEQVGSDLGDVVRGYLASLEFASRRMLAHRAGETVATRYPDFTIHTDAADDGIGRGIRSERYEPEVTAAFRARLAPGMGVIDIGANAGWYALNAAAAVGETGFVLAIEPNPDNARLLEASRRVNGFERRLVVAQVAAGAEIGQVTLHRSRTTGSVGRLDDPLAPSGTGERVAALPAALLVPAGRRIDVIKIDVDGGEHPAMLGCSAILSRDRPLVFSEFAPDMMPGVSGVDGRTYLDFLAGFGYRIGVIRDNGSIDRATDGPEQVLAAYRAANNTHIDLLAEPA